ncbi:MAG: serine/threonine protein kinase, partial [Myxococcaceae bacterium]|nr:serine/threonine protein kinase [Myxococcaceae bacterium]
MLRMELAEGVILDGHYRLRQLLGRGGMGEVWEAEHTRLPKQFAIKFLLALSRTEPELLMRFRREAEIASRLSHPSIVQVTDFNILPDGTAYIAMERLIGEDLRGRLARGPLSLSEVREITRQVASALTLAHREGIVHRDLKPENIFLCREADGALRAKVLDFGISKLQGAVHGTRDDRVLGTPGYMAPEQARGKNSAIDGRTDLFSLATIVYEMLTGKGVFMGDTLAELCTKVLYHTPPPLDQVLPSVPRPIALAVSMALSKDPAARQADIGLFADAVVGSSSPPSATSGFSPTLASNVSSLASLQARALAAETQALEPVPVDASDVVTRSERPSLPAQSQPARAGTKRMIAA